MKFSRRTLLKTVSAIALAASAGGWIHGSSLHTGALYNVTDPITTAQGELVFTVWRKYFFEAGLVTYTIGGGTAVNGVDYDGSLSPLSGTLNFAALDICQHVRIQTFGTGGVSNKPASGAAQVTLNLTLTGSTNGQIEDAVGNGTIQSGVVYYYSATGSDSNNGLTPATPFAYAGSNNSIQNKVIAAAAGTMLRLKRGDTWAITTSDVLIRSDWGGTQANPAIIGAYGTGADPIITDGVGYLGNQLLRTGGTNSGSAARFTIEDIAFQPTLVGKRDFMRNFNDNNVTLTGITFQRITFADPLGLNNMGSGFNCADTKFVSNERTWANNWTIQFCDISGCDMGIFVTGANGLLLGNNFHDIGHEPQRQWANYLTQGANGVKIWCNKFIDNIQNTKVRCGTGIHWAWNYYDNHAIFGEATVTGATVGVDCVFTISQNLSPSIPLKKLRKYDYIWTNSFQSGWVGSSSANPNSGAVGTYGGNGWFVIILDVPVSQGGTMPEGQYKTNWNTTGFPSFTGTALINSGGTLNVAFGFDTVNSEVKDVCKDCIYENNVQIGASGNAFGIAETIIAPPWGKGFVNFVHRNNLIVINSLNPQGENGAIHLALQTPWMDGVSIYHNTYVTDGYDYPMINGLFAQGPGAQIGPIGPVNIKNNILKRMNVESAATFMQKWGFTGINGNTVLTKVALDANLWNDSAAASNKFASVGGGGSNYSNLAAFKAAFPSQEAHGVSTGVTLGPYLGLGNLLPPNGSAAYGAGQPGLVTTDFIGNPRASIPTIGAIEVAA